jgi:hypothetical protein
VRHGIQVNLLSEGGPRSFAIPEEPLAGGSIYSGQENRNSAPGKRLIQSGLRKRRDFLKFFANQKAVHRMTSGGRFGASQQGGNRRAAASALSSGAVLNAMAAAGAALCTALTTASNSASP